MTEKTYAITVLIAPCGMNCRLCQRHKRDEKACSGCRGEDSFKMKSCITCRIKTCEKIVEGNAKYCFSCENFPCPRLKNLDKRYRSKYGMSMIDNLKAIKSFGIIHFVRAEKQKWTCPECSEMLCVHNPQCLSCGYKWLEKLRMHPPGDPLL